MMSPSRFPDTGNESGALSTCCRLAHASVPLLWGVFLGLLIPLATQAADAQSRQSPGEQIYNRGTSLSGDPITAYVGEDAVALPASAVPCGSCHGPDGRGRPEGGLTPSDITWSQLTKSYGHRHDYGRDHPAFDDASTVTAIAAGLDPAGNRLDRAMPRYSMSKEDSQALLDYLKRLEYETDAGITDDYIQLATLLPLSGPAAPLGAVLSAVMRAFVDELNAKGGLHGRRIGLRVLPLGNTPAEALVHLEQAIEREEIFAVVSAYSMDIEESLYDLVERERVPLIGPLTLRPPAGSALSRYTFQLLPTREQQVRVLVDYAVQSTEDSRVNGIVAGPTTTEVRALAAAGDAQGRSHGWAQFRSFNYEPGTLDADRLAEMLKVTRSQTLFFFGSALELSAVLEAAAQMGQAPAVFLLSDTVTPSLFEAPLAFDGRVFIAYPSLPRDVSDKGRAEFSALMEGHSLPKEYLSVQVNAYAAGAILAEAIKRAGRDLSRERLINALESLYRFETGLTPPVTFTLNQRVGALGAHVVKLDLSEKRYTPVGAWRGLD